MQSKTVSVVFILAMLVTLSSCKKSWECTCTGTLAGSTGGPQIRTFTINDSYKINAQADCNQDCGYMNSSNGYYNTSATVKPL